MKSIITLAFCFFLMLRVLCQVSICSWNLKDFGDSKSQQEIEYIATTIKRFDIIAIQEIVAGHGGAQAVARLMDALNRTGSSWDYALSEPTSSVSTK